MLQLSLEVRGYPTSSLTNLGKAKWLRRTAPPKLAHLVMIRTVLVTPTRVLIGAPQQEGSNSVTRRYSDRLDGIIRVQFTDEEDRLFVRILEKASLTHQMQDYSRHADQIRPDIGVTARIRRALQHGIIIGGRRFLPVASSSSQQK